MLYRFVYVLAFLVLKFCFFIRIYGADNYEKLQGGFIAMGNHTSNWDPIVLGFSIRTRPVHYLAKQELFRNKAAAFFLRRLYAVPVARGSGDIGAVRKALEILKQGGVLGIFPEGTRSAGQDLGRFEPGVALLALRSGCPVLPVYISGGYHIFHRVNVLIGPAIDLSARYPGKPNGAAARAAAEYLRERMEELQTSKGAPAANRH